MNYFNTLYTYSLTFLLIIFSYEESYAITENAPRDESPPHLKDWSEIVSPSLINPIDSIGSQIPDLIFGALSHFSFQINSNSHFDSNLEFGRDVYDNKTINGSWTVIDTIGIRGTIPLLDLASPLPGTMANLNFFIGTGSGIVFTDVRQVSPRSYATIPPLSNQIKDLQNDSKYQEYRKNSNQGIQNRVDNIKGQWIRYTNELDEKISSFLPADPESYARLSRVWNFSLIPFRLPLTTESFSQMEKNEIITYEGQGSIQMGVGAGWNLDPTELTGLLNAGVSFSTFVRGIFRISILKEENSIAKVKITKTGSFGQSGTAGFGYTPGILDNLIIISNLTNLIKVIPVQLNQTTETGKTFEVTYQYDLSTQNGKQAYENAVLGNLKSSDELAILPNGTWRTSLLDTSVVRLSNIDSKFTTSSFSDNMRLTFIFAQGQHGRIIDTETVLTTPDGKQRKLTALAENTKAWGLISNQYQKYHHNFLVNLDIDECEKDPLACQSFPMQLEGRIEDSNTSQVALLKYILEVENNIGIPNLFPRTPELTDIRNFPRDRFHPFFFYKTGHDLGNSNFYYQVKFSPEQVGKFINYPREQMWGALEKAFHIHPGVWSNPMRRYAYGMACSPVTLLDLFLNLFQVNLSPGTNLAHAENIHHHWEHLKEITKPKERAEALVHTFLDSLYSSSLAYLMRTVLDGEGVSYYANGSNRILGTINQQGDTKLKFEDLASHLVSEVEFTSPTSLSENDPNLNVNSLNLEQNTLLKQLVLNFDTSIVPKKVYIDLVLDDWSDLLIKNKLIFGGTLDNTGNISLGRNQLKLDINDQNSPLGELARSLRPDTRYLLRTAISLDGQNWGKVSETHFRNMGIY